MPLKIISNLGEVQSHAPAGAQRVLSVTSNKCGHCWGANVKITDFSLVQRQLNILIGDQAFTNFLTGRSLSCRA